MSGCRNWPPVRPFCSTFGHSPTTPGTGAGSCASTRVKWRNLPRSESLLCSHSCQRTPTSLLAVIAGMKAIVIAPLFELSWKSMARRWRVLTGSTEGSLSPIHEIVIFRCRLLRGVVMAEVLQLDADTVKCREPIVARYLTMLSDCRLLTMESIKDLRFDLLYWRRND